MFCRWQSALLQHPSRLSSCRGQVERQWHGPPAQLEFFLKKSKIKSLEKCNVYKAISATEQMRFASSSNTILVERFCFRKVLLVTASSLCSDTIQKVHST